MVKVNDIVRFLNDVGGGRVSRIVGNTVYVEDEDGFERPALAREVVVVGEAGNKAATFERKLDLSYRPVKPDEPAPKPEPKAPLPPYQETAEGERLNIVLAYQPREIKHLNTTTFFPVLVNDSNYWLYFAYLTRGDETSQWTTRAHGIVEPGMMEPLDEFGHNDLNDMTHIAVQYMAFKQERGFALKNPALVALRLDVTKFFRLHCFHENDYFDTPVLSVDIVRNDLPVKPLRIDSGELERAMKEKRQENKPVKKPVKKQPTHDDIVVQDLHIGELLDTTVGMSHADILNYQLDKFNEVMRAHMKHIGQRIVFIHGKGEGVLRRAIMEELKRHYPHCAVQDASFREYGFGATQVTIRNQQ